MTADALAAPRIPRTVMTASLTRSSANTLKIRYIRYIKVYTWSSANTLKTNWSLYTGSLCACTTRVSCVCPATTTRTKESMGVVP